MLKMKAVALMMAAEAAEGSGGGRVAFCKKDYDLDTGVVSFSFGNSIVVEVNVDDLPAPMQRTLMLHGMAQKGGDSYAGAKGNFTEGIANLQDVVGNLKNGEWGSSREGEGKPRLGELSAAIARVKGISFEDATTAVEAAPEDKRKTWRAHPKIKAAIAAIRAEKAQAELEKAAESGDIEL